MIPEHWSTAGYNHKIKSWKELNDNLSPHSNKFWVFLFVCFVHIQHCSGVTLGITPSGAQGILWDMGIQPGLTTCKANVLFTLLSFQPLKVLF